MNKYISVSIFIFIVHEKSPLYIMKTRVAVVDDHSVFRNGIINVLSKNENIEIVLEANHGKECIDLLQARNIIPDILLLDIQMPVMNGFETLDYFKKHYPSVKVIILSLIQDEILVNNFLRKGASGFIAKNAEPEQMLEIVERTMNGNLLGELDNIFLPDKQFIRNLPQHELSQKEFDLITYSSTGFTYEQIADHMLVTPKVLDHLRANLFKKLNIQSRQELASIAVRMGLAKQYN